MRVALIHNLNAGDGSHDTPDLVQCLRDAGHEVESFGSRRGDVLRAAATDAEVLVVGGGDGTVAKTAKLLHECRARAPMFVLPMGTSNNIARTLGATAGISELVRGLAEAVPGRLDIGLVDSPWDRTTFVEGTGFGFIGTMLEESGTARERIARAARHLVHPRLEREDAIARGVARLIRKQPLVRCEIEADGEDLSGDYVAVELLNIREIGPRIRLAPGADPGDGLLDLVLVRAEDRSALADHVRSRCEAPTIPGVTRRVKQIEMSWAKSGGHVDDEPWPNRGAMNRAGVVRVTLDGLVEVLLPAAAQTTMRPADVG